MKKMLLPLSYLLVIVASVLGTLVFTMTPPAAPGNSAGSIKLQELEQLLLDRFVDGVEAKALEDGAAYGMVEALGDRWSYYIPADEYAQHVESKKNAYVGIGVSIRQKPEGYQIIQVVSGGPAEEAGLLVDDVIVAVAGQSVAGMDATAGKQLIVGAEGSSVEITVSREGSELKFAVERRTIKTVVAKGRMLESDIGLVTIANFNDNCYKETMEAIDSLLLQGAKALIFDVRNNGGGYKHELVDVLNALLPEGVLFRSEYYTGAVETDESDARCLEMPMAVLVNGESYSAAEFFAAALQEYQWAIVVGEPTQGKGHYQETYVLSDGSAVGLSTGRYCTPNGVDLEGIGITPDILVEVNEEQQDRIFAGTLPPMEDPQVIAAIQGLKTAK